MNEKKHANSLKTNDDNPKKEKTNNSITLSVFNLSTLETFWIASQNKKPHVTRQQTRKLRFIITHFYNVDNIAQVL